LSLTLNTNRICHPQRWIALDRVNYRHRITARNSVDFSLDLNEPSVLIERRPGLNEMQTEGTDTEKARDAEVRVE